MLNLFCQKCGRLVEAGEFETPDKDGCIGACPNCGTALAPNRFIPPGTDVNGFLIKEEIGRGGMGIVYLAKQISLDRMVALKILSDEMASDEKFIQAFFREARSAAGLSHPNIVQAIDAGVAPGGIYYFVMELIEGQNLELYTAEHGAMPFELGLRCAVSISEALAYAWNYKKLVHRDIKPENIILKNGSEFKLADLGLAKDYRDTATATGTDQMATPAYASPEVIRRETGKIGFKSDMYSFGATLYQIFTGHAPFKGKTPAETCEKQLNEQPKPLIGVNPELPFRLSMLVDKLMEKNPEKRPATWDAVYEELVQISADPFPHRNRSPEEPDPEKRNAAAWLLVSMFLLALLTGTGLVFFILFGFNGKTPSGSATPGTTAEKAAETGALQAWENLKTRLSPQSDPYGASRELRAYLKKTGKHAPPEAHQMLRKIEQGPEKWHREALEELFPVFENHLSAETRSNIRDLEILEKIRAAMAQFLELAMAKRDWSAEKYPDTLLAQIRTALEKLPAEHESLERRLAEEKQAREKRRQERVRAKDTAFFQICRAMASGTPETTRRSLSDWKNSYKDVLTPADERKIDLAGSMAESLATPLPDVLAEIPAESLRGWVILPKTLPAYRFYKTTKHYLYAWPADVPAEACRKHMKKFSWSKLNRPGTREKILADLIFGTDLVRTLPVKTRKILFEKAVFQKISAHRLKARFASAGDTEGGDEASREKKIFSCLDFLPQDFTSSEKENRARAQPF